MKIRVLLAVLIAIPCFYSCMKDHNLGKRIEVDQVNLVSDTIGFGAARTDTNLNNAWGIAAAPGGPLWISSNHKGVSVVYSKTGQTLKDPVTIPSIALGQTGAPTGVIFNGTADFGANKFIFASEDGIVAGWSSGNSATTVADRSSFNAVYKGIAMANDGTANFLYLTNFKGGKIDVFDKNFNYVTDKPFMDPGVPAGFAPFNIVNIGGKLYVSYAKLKGPDNMDDQAGPGNGYVDIFTPGGILVKRFASQGKLNSPWGIALAPAGFGDEKQSTILIGNFGDGRINIFDLQGHFEGQLQSKGQALTIDGLWDIDFLENNMPGGNSTDPLFFTAGPNEEGHGLFGYVQKK
ncbi:TIGR03118 family protein [Mucilaginibacter sp. BT774]|uniref:TIGR03118 family protein n=1 Tax=Mucilaginibacter sp. BT774 TaxID=3062276 RepID=UPI002676EA6B|nr:TIGR03118 family protein [Mucilaginibacter sp. BT774]MDO3626955.1 TIGR03118 family protein [Mucilaginibacter sp. BT774]